MLKMFADLSHTIVSEKSVSDNFGYWDTWEKQILTVWEYQDSWIKTRLNLISPNVFLNKFFRNKLISGARLHRRCQVFWDLTDGGIFELRDLIEISVYGGFSLSTISISFIFFSFLINILQLSIYWKGQQNVNILLMHYWHEYHVSTRDGHAHRWRYPHYPTYVGYSSI